MAEEIVVKSCIKCKELKPLDQFARNRVVKSGRIGTCHDCRHQYNAAYWKLKPNRPTPETLRKHNLRRHYGLTPEQYDEMLTEQGDVCAICENPEKRKHKKQSDACRLAVDHCHKTGKVRGLLCSDCNRALGQFGDDPELLQKAILYLQKHS